jgi:hypothetical protein
VGRRVVPSRSPCSAIASWRPPAGVLAGRPGRPDPARDAAPHRSFTARWPRARWPRYGEAALRAGTLDAQEGRSRRSHRAADARPRAGDALGAVAECAVFAANETAWNG